MKKKNTSEYDGKAVRITKEEASKYKDRKLICSVTERMIFEDTHYSKGEKSTPLDETNH